MQHRFSLKILFLLCLLSISFKNFAQVFPKPDLIPYRKANLFGFADQQVRIIIPPAYDQVSFFKDGYARVYKDHMWAIINKQGNLKTEIKYHSLSDLREGFFSFREFNRQGFLDTLGQEVIVLPEGHFVSNNFNSSGLPGFCEGMALIGYREKSDSPARFYFIDKTGKRLNTPEIIAAKYFRNGKAQVNFLTRKGRDRWTLIDRQGRDLLNKKHFLHDTIAAFGQTNYRIRTRTKYSWFKKNREHWEHKQRYKYGLLNQNLEQIVPVKFRGLSVQNNFVVVRDWFGKGGFWNYQSRNKLTRRRFDRIETSGFPARAAVSSLAKQGLMDSLGNFIIPLGKHWVHQENRYKENYQEFKSLGLNYTTLFYLETQNGKTAIDPFGNKLSGFHYGALTKITDSLIIVSRQPSPSTEPANAYEYEGDYNRQPSPTLGLLNTEGTLLVEPFYHQYQVNPANALVVLYKDTVISYFNETGIRLATRKIRSIHYFKPTKKAVIAPFEKVTPAELDKDNFRSCFNVMQQLSFGYAIVGNSCLFTVKTLGLIDDQGKVILPFQYNEIFPVSATTLLNRQANKWGLYNLDGTPLLPMMMDKIILLENGNFLAGEIMFKGQMYFRLRNSQGQLILDDWIRNHPVFSGQPERAWLNLNKGGYIEIDRSGKVLSRITNPGVSPEQTKPGIYYKHEEGIMGFKDLAGKPVIPAKYSSVKYFSEGLAPVQRLSKWGYIDKSGNEIIPLQYEEALPFSEEKAFVATIQGYQVISKTGQVLFPGFYEEAKPFSEGLAAVKKNQRWGVINNKGKVVVPFKYDQIEPFREGIAIYKLGYFQGYMDKKGKEIVPPKYYSLQPFRENFGWVKNYRQWYKVNRQGQLLDSAVTKTFEPEISKSRTYLKGNYVYLRNPDGTETLLGDFYSVQQESEGLIGTQFRQSVYYYIDEKGNRFFEE